MRKDIERWIAACLTCRRRKATRLTHSDAQGIICKATRRWEEIAIDLVEASSTSTTQHKYILTVICLFTRYVIAIPLKSKKAKEVAEGLFSHVFAVHGKPDRIRSDEGREFVNAGLNQLYRRWNIQPITTGGWRPWSNPVERYHRYLNAGMTMLSARFGEDWTSYLQAIVFSYNASACRSTGYSPHYLIYGKEPTLLEDIAMIHPHDHPEPTETIIDSVTRMRTAYIAVRAQQERVAQINKQRADAKLRPVKYEVGDHVLYWEPQQSKSLRNDEVPAEVTCQVRDEGEADTDMNEREQNQRAPSKWTPKWTGPHQVVKTSEGSSKTRYTILHVGRRKNIINVHSDKLHPYQPWSASFPSTSAELDRSTTKYMIGSWCKANHLFIAPLDKPWPFGVARVLEAHDDGTLDYQWFNTKGHQATKDFKPMWWNKTVQVAYAARSKRSPDHIPYGGEESKVAITQHDIALHYLKLTPKGHLPKVILDACSEHPDIHWTRK